MDPVYGYSHKNTLPKVDFPQATAPVIPIISPGFVCRVIFSKIAFSPGYAKLKFSISIDFA